MNKLDNWDKVTDLFLFLDNSKKFLLPTILDDADKIIEFRSDLRDKINLLSEVCDKNFGVKTTYFLMFPVVIYCDETISVFFAEHNVNWPKMQKEIYDVQNGGEKFYELLEQTLEQPTFPELVYQLNYLILRSGFKGQLIDMDHTKTQHYYLGKLEEILATFYEPEENVPEVANLQAEKISWFTLGKENLGKYYFIPAVLSVIIFYFITITAINIALS